MVEQIIMRIDSQPSTNFDVEHISPTPGKPFSEQVRNCIGQLASFLDPRNGERYFITQQTFFIAARDRAEYDERSALIRRELASLCGASQPATSVVAQSPAPGSEVVLELICTRASRDKRVIYKRAGEIPYTVVDYGHFKAVHCAGLMGATGDSVTEAAKKAFESAVAILDREELAIHHIIRQWNYIEDIAWVNETGGAKQNYQDFNDVRADYYERSSFSHGYPAATGIGMDTGGVIIDFIALSESDRVRIMPIGNPGQIDAHRYSEEVLMGGAPRKCTPKFERAKMVSIGSEAYFYVSGTASILGEKTMYPGDVAKQTETTIENIRRLFSRENQDVTGIRFELDQIRYSHLRVYVKQKEDIPVVSRICEERLNSSSYLYLESDVCREELLVEIEGVFTIHTS